MPEEYERPVGLTKDAGWQIGVRRTLPVRSTEMSVPCARHFAACSSTIGSTWPSSPAGREARPSINIVLTLQITWKGVY